MISQKLSACLTTTLFSWPWLADTKAGHFVAVRYEASTLWAAGGEVIGQITSVQEEPDGQAFALGYVRCRRKGQQVQVVGKTVQVGGASGELVEVPFLTREFSPEHVPHLGAQNTSAPPDVRCGSAVQTLFTCAQTSLNYCLSGRNVLVMHLTNAATACAVAARQRQTQRRQMQRLQKQSGCASCRSSLPRGKPSNEHLTQQTMTSACCNHVACLR